MPPRRRAGVRAPRHESHRVRRCAQRPRSGGERGVQLGERLEPALLTGGRQMLREPLADLESRPSVGLVVELDSDPRLERLETLGQLAGDVHGAVEQLAVDDLHEAWRELRLVTGLYLPREVFFGRLVFAGAFVPVCPSDLGLFFLATSGSFRLMYFR